MVGTDDYLSLASTSASLCITDNASLSTVGSQDLYLFILPWFYIVLTIGTFGNVLTIVAFVKYRFLNTSTNYLIFNQSIADLGGTLCAYVFIFFTYHPSGMRITSQSKLACLMCLFLVCVTSLSSVMNVLGFSSERFIVVVFPYVSLDPRKSNIILTMIGIMWTTVLTICIIPSLGWNTWNPFQHCIISSVFPQAYFRYGLIMPVFISLLLMLVLNVVVASWSFKRKFRRVAPQAGSLQRSHAASGSKGMLPPTTLTQSQDLTKWKITKMILLVICVFYMCWLPYCVLLFLTHTSWVKNSRVFLLCFELSKGVLSLGPFFNLMIYAKRNPQFRRAYAKLLCLKHNSSP